MYLRDRKSTPIGCIAIDESRTGIVSFQYSVLNPIDVFERKIARYLALGKLIEMPINLQVSRTASRHEVSRLIMADIANNSQGPSRARRAAKLWLKNKAAVISD